MDTATSLRLRGAGVRREDLLLAYLDHLAGLLARVDARAVRTMRRAPRGYRAAAPPSGRRSGCTSPGCVARVAAVAVDDAGRLVVRRAGRRAGRAAGDVVHVRPRA